MKNIQFLLLVVLFGNSFKAFAQSSLKYIDETGIQREYLESVDKEIELTGKYDYTSNECNNDNEIYKPNKEFVYNVETFRNGQQIFLSLENGAWKFYNSKNDYHLETIGFEILEGNIFGMTQCDYNYYLVNGESSEFEISGIIENKRNVWLHPPRSKYFKILELNPFPFVQFPDSIGHSWKWELEIGDGWSNPMWKEWKGEITNSYNYSIISKELIDLYLGEIEVSKIEAIGISKLGQTELICYFNDKLGFVRMEYRNIDNSMITLCLTEIRDVK